MHPAGRGATESNQCARLTAIRLPPLDSPRRGPRKKRSFPTELWHARLGRRLPVPGHARRRLPVHRRTPECVGPNVWPSASNPQKSRRATSLAVSEAGYRRSINIRRRVNESLTANGRDIRAIVNSRPRRDSAMAVSVGGGALIDKANSERKKSGLA